MPVEPIVALILLAVLANVALMAAVAVPPLLRAFRARRAEREGRRGRGGTQGKPQDLNGDPMAAVAPAAVADPAAEGNGGRPYDRLVRVAAWTFILFTTTLVALADLWPEFRPAIIVLLAVAGFLVLIVHDILPPRIFGSASFLIEGSIAVVFVTALIGLTGGASSPFFFVYPLVVVGAALVVSVPETVTLAVLSSTMYVGISLLIPMASTRQAPIAAVARVAVDVVALTLLAFVAAFVAREQRRSRDAAIRLSTLDSLTGLFNRAYFFSALEREIARSDRSGRGFCLLMMDLDGLKTTNDRYGHHVGDRVLRSVGDVVRRGVRRIDTPARYGGDEFVVLLPETDPSGAFVLAEKIRLGVAEKSFDIGRRGAPESIGASVSVGVVTYPDDGATADELMISADKAMYASKRGGKNRVIDYASARGTGAGTGR